MSDARVFERGFQTYEGLRSGMRGAAMSVMRVTAQKAFGIRRHGREKFFPFLVLGITFLPALATIILSAMTPLESVPVLPGFMRYSTYYGGIVAIAILLFTSFVAPETICDDRRSGLLPLYLSAALNRSTYVAAKAGSIASVLFFVTMAPPLLMLLGLSITGNGPDAPPDAAVLLVRMLASATVIAVYFTAIALGVSSLTDRRAFAAAAIILLFIGSNIASGILVRGFQGPDELQVLNVFNLPLELVRRIFGERGELGSLSSLLVSLGTACWVAFFYGLAWIRYQRLSVTR